MTAPGGAQPSGHPVAPKQLQAWVMTIVTEAGYRHVEFDIKARPTTKGGIQLSWRRVPAQFGCPAPFVVEHFVKFCNAGLIMKRVELTRMTKENGEVEIIWAKNDDGSLKLVPVNTHFELVNQQPAEPNAEDAPGEPPPSRIITE